MYGTIAMIGTLASTSSPYLANIITGFYLSNEQVGFYSAAVSIASVLIYAPTVLGRVLLPTISSSYGIGDDHVIKRLLNVTTIWLFLIVLFFGGIFIILSRDILNFLFSPSFMRATFSLQMLVLGLCLATLAVPAISALSGTRYVKIPNVAGIIGLLVSLSIWPYLIPRFGINGTAIGYALGSIVTSIIILFYANKYFGLWSKKLCFIGLVCTLIFILTNFITMLMPSYPDLIAAAFFASLFLIAFKRDIYNLCSNVSTLMPIIDMHDHP
jgi:O-antigen/teichoic acid export membrane protein